MSSAVTQLPPARFLPRLASTDNLLSNFPHGEVVDRIEYKRSDASTAFTVLCQVWAGSIEQYNAATQKLASTDKEYYLSLLGEVHIPGNGYSFAQLLLSHDQEALEHTIDLAMDYYDELLIAREFAACNRAFASMNNEIINGIDTSVLVAILLITHRAKQHLGERTSFYNRVFQSIARRKGKRYSAGLLERYK